MSGSALEDNDNIKRNGLIANNEALIGDNRDAEPTESRSASSESLLFQEGIQTTLSFNQQIKEYDRSIKRIEKRMAAQYVKLDRIPETEESNTSSKKKSKKKKGKMINKKGKKKIKKLKRKGKTKLTKALTNAGKKKGRRKFKEQEEMNK